MAADDVDLGGREASSRWTERYQTRRDKLKPSCKAEGLLQNARRTAITSRILAVATMIGGARHPASRPRPSPGCRPKPLAAPAPGGFNGFKRSCGYRRAPEPSAWPPSLEAPPCLSRAGAHHFCSFPPLAAPSAASPLSGRPRGALAEWERAAPSRSAGDSGATLTALLRRVALLHYPRDRGTAERNGLRCVP